MARVKHIPTVIDKGIERIVRQDRAESPVTPGSVADVAPATAPARPRLEQLFSQPNLEDYLAEQLAPQVGEAAFLQPHRFGAALQNALETLREATDTDPRNAKILRPAARLLADQVALQDLLKMYRSALLQG